MSPDGAGSGGPEADRPPRTGHYLHPGHVFVSREPATVLTVLGSCVAVCVWDPARGVGGMNHFLLPHRVEARLVSPRYGNVAIATLVQQVLEAGGRPEGLQAKLFGGAAILAAPGRTRRSLGAQNTVVARSILEERGIPIVAEDVGGTRGRRLVFRTSDGAVWLKRLRGAGHERGP